MYGNLGRPLFVLFFFFFFNDTATTEIYTLSLHDALPISSWQPAQAERSRRSCAVPRLLRCSCTTFACSRSEEHTSELQSRPHLVCRLLLEKKKKHVIPRSCTKRKKESN